MPSASRTIRVETVVGALERLAPTALAQSWDNVGLLAGDRTARVRRVLACIDLTAAVAAEARRRRAQLVIAYHPPLFRPVQSLTSPGPGTEAILLACLRHGIAVYSPHTALDAAAGGTNDVLADLCGARDVAPLEHAPRPGVSLVRVTVESPTVRHRAVAGVLGSAGSVHELGAHEAARLEATVERGSLPALVARLEDAGATGLEVTPLEAAPGPGIGRVGTLPDAPPLGRLAARLARRTGARHVQLVGSSAAPIRRVVVVVGAAGDLPFAAALGPDDAVVTGEIRHHDALALRRIGAHAVALGHWASERPVLASLVARLVASLPGLDAAVSDADCDPFDA